MMPYGRGFERWLHQQLFDKPAPRAPRRPLRRGPARDWKYKAWIRSLPSAVSGRPGCEAHHTGEGAGMSQKASDFTCIPLTAEEHREYHRVGRAAWEAENGISVAELVRRLNHDWFAYGRAVK